MIAVAIIPARGGSKGIPRKNIVPVAGRPLLAYTADAARQSKRLSRTILSTDDEEIADVARELGLEVPFLRPADLANDMAKSVSVMLHAASFLAESNETPDVLVLLQPTAPLRTAKDIDEALSLFEREQADSVVSVTQVPAHYAVEWQLDIGEDGDLTLCNGRPLTEIVTRRQLLKKRYWRNGAIYAIRTSVLTSNHSLYGNRCKAYVMPVERSVNIDGPEDLIEAERVLMSASAHSQIERHQ